jgi:hypothetical protein
MLEAHQSALLYYVENPIRLVDISPFQMSFPNAETVLAPTILDFKHNLSAKLDD